MEEKKIIPNEQNAELSDGQLGSIAGSLFVQTGSVTCSKCGKCSPIAQSAKDMRRTAKAER